MPEERSGKQEALRRIREARGAGAVELSLMGLDLGELPEELWSLTNLQYLDLSSNQLSSLPTEISQLTNLQNLYLRSNSPQLDQMQELFDKTPKDLWTYLRSLREDAEPIYEAKLLLVGEGAVGKSSLLAALLDQDFEEERATTHGIEVASLSLPHPDPSLDETIKDGHGIPALRAAIAKAAAGLPQMGERFSARWQRVRDQLKEQDAAHVPLAQVRDSVRRRAWTTTSAPTPKTPPCGISTRCCWNSTPIERGVACAGS